MRSNILEKVITKVAGKGKAQEAVYLIEEGEFPDVDALLPEIDNEMPEVIPPVSMVPPSDMPPVESGQPDDVPPMGNAGQDDLPVGGPPEVDESTGLPMIAMDKTPAGFPGSTDDLPEDSEDELTFLFG